MPEHRRIGKKWVYKKRLRATTCIDFEEDFAPVAWLKSVRHASARRTLWMGSAAYGRHVRVLEWRAAIGGVCRLASKFLRRRVGDQGDVPPQAPLWSYGLCQEPWP
jgi:hypothetical protein